MTRTPSDRRQAPSNPLATRLRPAALAVHLALASVFVGGATLGLASAAYAQSGRDYAIVAGPLGPALTRFAGEAGVVLSFDPASVAGKSTPGLNGNYAVDAGFNALLAGSGYRVGRTAAGYTLIAAPERGADAMLPAVNVTAGADAGELPAVYPGGQVARGARLGILGNKDLLDTPFNTVSYTAELIANQNASTVAEVLQNDPSVRFTTPAGHMVENYYIRGFLVTADNMAMNGLYGLAPYGHVPTEFIERVEVLKGPSALLNGMAPAGAVGGTINLVPKRAEDAPITRLSADYTSASQLGTHVDVGRRFGSEKELGVRFNGAYRDGETDIDSQSKTRSLAALALDYRSAAVRLNLDVYDNVEKAENGSPLMISFARGVVTPPDSSTNLFKGTYATMKNSGLMLHGEVDFNDYLSGYASVGTRHNSYQGFINGTRANSVTASGQYTGSTTHQNGYTDSLSYEAGLRGKLKTGAVGHEIVLSTTVLELETGTLSRTGASYVSNIYSPKTPVIAPYPGAAPKTGETTLSSVALADTLSFAQDKVALTLGVRQQQVEDKAYGPTGLVTSNYDQSKTTPAVGLVVKPWDAPVSLYANYIEGLSKGGTTPATAANPNVAFAPYLTEQREVGVKWDAGRYAHTLSLYQIGEPIMIRNAATNVYSLDGEKLVRGLEWTVIGEVASDLRLLGGATLARSEQVKTSNGVNDGKDAYGVPAWQANLGVEWDTPWLPGVTLSGRAVHTAAQYLDSANTLEIPSWTRYDAGLRYATRIAGRSTTFNATVSNLFDKDYWVGPYHGEGYTTLSAPRTLTLSATIDF